MPVLRQPVAPLGITLPPRHAVVAGDSDVLVVGGGMAGVGAAVGAANAGARVILVERHAFLGGHATAALVVAMGSYHTWQPAGERPRRFTLFPVDHGPGQPVIAGVLETIVKRLVERGGAVPPSPDTGFVVPFDPEIFKLTAMELLDEAGVQFLFHAQASAVLGQPPDGVVFETKSGPLVIQARAIVDCTGDGDIAAFAGASYDAGRDEDGLMQPITLMFIMGGFRESVFEAYAREHPDQWLGVNGLSDLVKKATSEGRLQLPREDMLMFGTPRDDEISVNCTRVTRVNGTNVWDLSYAEWAGRRQMAQIAAFLRQYVPGFEEAYISQSGSNAGVRETRRIKGLYRLTEDDILGARKFDDVIARGTYPIDIHNPLGKGTILRRVPPGMAYDIPLRSLLPADIENVVVAGRCISGTHEAMSSYRTMPVCVATGHAAGVCAALAVRSGRQPREVTAGEVQAELLRQGANLGGRSQAASFT